MEAGHVYPLFGLCFFVSFARTENILSAKTEKIYESKQKQEQE